MDMEGKDMEDKVEDNVEGIMEDIVVCKDYKDIDLHNYLDNK
jgi:hypothetical protein